MKQPTIWYKTKKKLSVIKEVHWLDSYKFWFKTADGDIDVFWDYWHTLNPSCEKCMHRHFSSDDPANICTTKIENIICDRFEEEKE